MNPSTSLARTMNYHSSQDNPAPLVSVVIPVFNDAVGVDACLTAIQRQEYPLERLDVIVVDNGSTLPVSPRTDYGFTLRVVRCSTRGSYAARNAGSRVARGSVLAFTDADCIPDTGWLAQGVRTLLRFQGRYLVGGDVRIVLPETRSGTALYQYEIGFGQESNITHKYFSATANLLCTKEQFAAIGPFDERLLSGGDREWSWRARAKGIPVQFEPASAVYTQARTTLNGAIRQARRVAAGRMMLRELGLQHAGPAALERHRSACDSIRWILTRRNLTLPERGRVLFAAVIIRFADMIEQLRLSFGASPERR